MTPFQFPPSVWDLIDALRNEDPTLSEVGAAYRIIDDLQAKIFALNAKLNERHFREMCWGLAIQITVALVAGVLGGACMTWLLERP